MPEPRHSVSRIEIADAQQRATADRRPPAFATRRIQAMVIQASLLSARGAVPPWRMLDGERFYFSKQQKRHIHRESPEKCTICFMP